MLNICEGQQRLGLFLPALGIGARHGLGAAGGGSSLTVTAGISFSLIMRLRLKFFTSAAPLAKKVLPHDYPKLPNILMYRILKILSVAKSKGHDSLILGAWGCGAFGNDGNLVSELFNRALTVEFAGSFKEVTFAIVDTSPEQRFIGPFAQRFQAQG